MYGQKQMDFNAEVPEQANAEVLDQTGPWTILDYLKGGFLFTFLKFALWLPQW